MGKRLGVIIVPLGSLVLGLIYILYVAPPRSANGANSAVVLSPTSQTRPPRFESEDLHLEQDDHLISAAVPPTPALRSPITEKASAKLSRMRAQMQQVAADENWREAYSGVNTDVLKQERTSLERDIVTMTRDAFEQRFSAGEYQLTDEIGVHLAEPDNPFEITWLRFSAGERIRKCTLPEEGYDAAYKMRAKSVWLLEEIGSRAHQTEAAKR